MPRKPFFRTFDGWWYAQLDTAGKRRQVKLVKGKENEQEAYRAFCLLLADEGQIDPKSVDQSVAHVCDRFLDASQRDHTPATFAAHKYFLQDFCDRHGRLMTCDVRPFHVAAWLDAHPKWKGARQHAVGALKRAFNWAEAQGYVTANPIRRVFSSAEEAVEIKFRNRRGTGLRGVKREGGRGGVVADAPLPRLYGAFLGHDGGKDPRTEHHLPLPVTSLSTHPGRGRLSPLSTE